jgi:hypothetical protein
MYLLILKNLILIFEKGEANQKLNENSDDSDIDSDDGNQINTLSI